MIRYDKVSKQYGQLQPALSDISLEIADGEFVFLIGPSGAGKTTVLRLLTRDLDPTSGSIFVDEEDISTIRSKSIYLLRRKIGMIFQDFKLLSERTVYENVAIPLEILGKKEDEVKKSVEKILDIVGLSKKTNLFPQQLSAGEMQRTSIARSLVGGPKVLLADEPTGNLDPETAWGILKILSEVNSIGTTIIMATHNTTIVNDMKKRTITIHDGMIVRDETHGKYHTGNDKHDEDNGSDVKNHEHENHHKEKKHHGNS